MRTRPTITRNHLFAAARSKLGLFQRDFGPALGVSHRTAVRWDQGKTIPGDPECIKLARLIHPVDPQLAEQAALHVAETLESLGIVAPPLPPPAEPPPTPVETQPAPAPSVSEPPVPTPVVMTKPHDLADIVLCAVADANGVVPKTLRPMLYVAFKRAREVGLTVEQVEQAFAPEPPPPTDPTPLDRSISDSASRQAVPRA